MFPLLYDGIAHCCTIGGAGVQTLVSVISWSKWENGGFNGFSIVVIAYPLTPPAPIQVDK